MPHHTMSKTLAILLVIAGCPSMGNCRPQEVIRPQRFEFKTDKLGNSLPNFKSKHELDHPDCTDNVVLGVSVPDTDNKVGHGIVECSLSVYIVDRPAMAHYTFLDGSLYEILVDFPHEGFEDTVRGVSKKYGPEAAMASKTVENMFGARFSGKTYIWHDSDDILLIAEYVTSLKRSALMIEDTKREATAKSRMPKKKGDL